MGTQVLIRQRNSTWQFPDFKVDEYFKKKNKYAICVFVINEGGRIQNQLKKMKSYAEFIDIIVADGGSSDNSLNPNFLKTVKVRTLLTKIGAGKLSAQMRMAFVYVLNEGYKGVVVVDGNDKDDISAIPNFIDLLDEGYDHIQGSRFISGGKSVNTPPLRYLAAHFIHAPLISLAAHHRYTDTTNGFRAYSAKLIQDKQLAVFRNVFQTYELHYYLAIESARVNKYRLIETPVTRVYPKKGKTPTKISPLRGNFKIIMILYNSIRRKYREK